MLDYQRIVDDVRSTLHTANPATVDYLRAAAADYLLACEQVNDRLRRCGGLLRQGLRSEALHLCDLEPNLLDVVAMLDFPERGEWIRVLTPYGVAAPPPLMLDVAAELNQAYALEQPLAALLDRHRLLALARCPLPMRVNVLREIAQADAGNPVWLEDLQAFEKERLRQIQQEASDSAQAGDVAVLTALDAELNNEGWLELPPAGLTRWVASARQRLEDGRAMSDLAQIAEQLGAAYSAGDLDASRQWRARWESRLNESGLAEAGPLDARLAPALEWLREQDELDELQADHEAALAVLESALRAGLPADRLTTLHEAASRHGHSIPPHVENRYRARLAAVETSRRRRIALASATLLFCLAAIVAAIVGIAVERGHSRDVEAHAAALTDLLANGQWDEAETLFHQLTAAAPRVVASSEVRALRRRLDDLKDAERKRSADFESAFAQATESGPGAADRNAHARAGELAATAEERSRVADFQRQLTAEDRRLQQARDEQFLSGLPALEARIAELEEVGEAGSGALRARIIQLRTDIKAHEQQSQPGRSVLGESSKLLARLEQIELDARRRAEEATSEEQLTRAIGDSGRFRQALDEFRAAHPDTARARDFERAIEEATLWDGVDQWNGLVADWRRTAIYRLDAAAAQGRTEAADALLAEYGNFPQAESLREKRPYLEAIAGRTDVKGERLDAGLKRIFTDPLVAGLWMIELADGSRYYLTREPTIEAGKDRIPVKYIVGLDGLEKGTTVKTADIVYHGAAPQNALAADIVERLGSLIDGNWDDSFLSMGRRIGEDAETDPILKTVLLKAVLQVGTKGSRSFELALRAHSRTLAGAPVDGFTNWLNPRREELPTDREKALEFLEGLPSFTAAETALAQQHQLLERPVAPEYRWVGWLRRSAGAWHCHTVERVAGTGELFVVCRASQSAVKLPPVGRLAEGIPTLDTSALELLEGRPVFMVP